jgi:hypothetical protein
MNSKFACPLVYTRTPQITSLGQVKMEADAHIEVRRSIEESAARSTGARFETSTFGIMSATIMTFWFEGPGMTFGFVLIASMSSVVMAMTIIGSV